MKNRSLLKYGIAVMVIAGSAVFFAVTVSGTNRADESSQKDIPSWEPIPITELQEETAIIPLPVKQYKDVPFIPLPVPLPEEDQQKVFQICQEKNIAFPLVMAMIERESAFQQYARSETGDSGYMQINDCNVARMAAAGYTDMFSLEGNVGAGTSIMAELLQMYEGETTAALMAYNAGPEGKKKMNASGIFSTNYSRAVEARAKEFSDYIDTALID